MERYINSYKLVEHYKFNHNMVIIIQPLLFNKIIKTIFGLMILLTFSLSHIVRIRIGTLLTKMVPLLGMLVSRILHMVFLFGVKMVVQVLQNGIKYYAQIDKIIIKNMI